MKNLSQFGLERWKIEIGTLISTRKRLQNY